MPKPSQINVQCRGGLRGSYIDISQLIDKTVKLDVIEFKRENKSNVRGCDFYCRMQIRVGNKLCVTWHSSELLTNYLEDCKQHEAETGESIFPIEDCVISVGEDKGYYLIDATEESFVPSEKEFEKIVDKAHKSKR